MLKILTGLSSLVLMAALLPFNAHAAGESVSPAVSQAASSVIEPSAELPVNAATLPESVSPKAQTDTTPTVQTIDSATDLDYTIQNGDYGYGAYVTGYSGKSKAVVVPAQLGGADVVSIDLESLALTSLDVRADTALTYLGCDYNSLTSLDVSKNTALTQLWCIDNSLASLDVSKNTALTDFWLDGNLLISLDVSKNTALEVLECENNLLTSLDISKNTALTGLYCGGNLLASLDVSKNTALAEIQCGNNELTSLDVSANTELATLYCSDNYITDTSALTAWLGISGHEGQVAPQNPKIGISSIAVSSIPAQTYTGVALTPELSVTF